MESLVLFSYIGPDTVLPLGSMLTAATGLALVFWRQPMAVFKRLFSLAKRGEK